MSSLIPNGSIVCTFQAKPSPRILSNAKTDHIPHELLTIYALGASPEEVKTCYDRNKRYQRPALPANQDIVQSMHDVAKFKECSGKEENYPHYLAFFQQEIDAKGVPDVLNEYLFAEDERAESMMCRVFAGKYILQLYWAILYCMFLGLIHSGLIHPFIQLGFGIEFNQPAIVAQGLAQIAVHDDWLGRAYFLPAAKMAGGIGKPGQKSLFQLINEIRADKTLVESVQWSDSNKIKDGVLHRAPEQMLKYASQFTVSKDQVHGRLADMTNTVGKSSLGSACLCYLNDASEKLLLNSSRQSTIPVPPSVRPKKCGLISS